MLKVIGLFPYQIGEMVYFELLLVTIPGIIVGIPVSYLLSKYFLNISSRKLDNLHYSVLYVAIDTFIFSIVGLGIGLFASYVIATVFVKKVNIKRSVVD